MPRSEVREIMDELNNLGGMTSAHMVLITELVAVCLSAASHQPLSGAERTRRWRDKEKKVFSDDVTSHVTETAVNNNNITLNPGEGGVGGEPAVTRASRGTRLPDDWNPSENLWSWGKEKLIEADLRFETAAFKDFWAAKPGQAGTKLDWDKTWKTWMREAVRRRDRFKPKDNVTTFVASGPKRSWQEIKAEKEGKND
jgi:hypothetical protein